MSSKADKVRITVAILFTIIAIMFLILSSCQKETTDRYLQDGEQSAQMSAEQRLREAIELVSQ